MSRELPIPPKADDDPKSTEILRAWVTAEDHLVITLNLVTWDDEIRCWGIFLADILQHITKGIEEDGGVSESEAREAILEMFHLEVESPTDKARGSFYE
jgi:hypothetical protein